jgi:hypothetical protein
MKLAIHDNGYVYRPSGPEGPSTPRTKLSDGDDGLRVPKLAVKNLRKCFAEIYPELAKKPFVSSRLCWSVLKAYLLFEILTMHMTGITTHQMMIGLSAFTLRTLELCLRHPGAAMLTRYIMFLSRQTPPR